MSNNIYTGTGFSHNIPFSDYASLTREEILNKYNDTPEHEDYFEQHGVCTNVVDGDTIDVHMIGGSAEIRVRLVGVNAPESTANGYLCSKKFVEKLCLNQMVKVYQDSENEEDDYGRILAVISIDNKNLNEILLKEGLAEVMYIPPSEFLPFNWINNNNEKTFITIDKNISNISMKKSPFSFDEDNKIEIKEKNLIKNTSLNQNFILDETNWSFPQYDYGGASSVSQINFDTENNNGSNTDFSFSGSFYGLLNLPTSSTRWILKFDFKIHNFSALQMNATFAFGGNDATVLAPYEYGKKSLTDPLSLKFSSESNPHNDQDFSTISSTAADEEIISQGNFYQMMIIRWDNNCILICNNQYMIDIPLNADALNMFGFHKRKTGGALTIRNLSLFDISSQEEIEEEQQTENMCNNPISLQSTIINQKKKLFLYVQQSKNLVYPNTEYDYQVYVKNISGQTIENIKIYITNPKEVVLPERTEASYEIPTLKTGQSVLINIDNCTIMQEGYYHVNFIAMGDETEIQTQSLLIKCGYENDNKNTLHRIAFYNFSPYEEAYMERASDYSENVTQLTKIQTKPFEAYNQPFEMDELELDLHAQDIFLTNTDDMPSMYLGRENWESNLKEMFTGETLMNLIQKINNESELVDIDFLRVGSNEMETNFQRIYPNGFIHRFGLIKSEFYKLLGIIPRIYSLNDDLFRWARDESEPQIYPKRENDKWNQKPWCGTGYYVYEYEIDGEKKSHYMEKAIFSTEEDAEIYVDDLITFNSLHFIENIGYVIKRRDWLPGIFYVEIPIRDIPTNFLIPDINEIQAIIELSKPFGLKGYPRFQINGSFMHQMQFSNVPTFTPQTSIISDDYQPIQYHIRQRKYQNASNGIQLSEFGKQLERNSFEIQKPSFFSYNPIPSICKTLTHFKGTIDDVRYFFMNKKTVMIQGLSNLFISHNPYIRIYSIEYADYFNNNMSEHDMLMLQNQIGSDIDVLRVSQDELIDFLNNTNMPIQGLLLNYKAIYDEQTEEITETIDERIFTENFCAKDRIFNDDLFVVINKYDNSISTENNIEDFKIKYNNGLKSFDGKRKAQNSLNKLLSKNPEDISFYIKDNQQYSYNILIDENNIENIPHIPIRYKSLDYYNKDMSTALHIDSSGTTDIHAIKITKQSLPLHVNFNLLLSNTDKTKDFIISYKKLDDNTYQISYKTYKNKEVIVKEIITQFDYILCEIIQNFEGKDLIKIYYCLDEKIYFITAFNADIIKDDISYDVRLSLTNDLTLSSEFEMSLGNISFGQTTYTTSNEYQDWYLINKQYQNIISTDNYNIIENTKSDTNWYKLYKINKDETSFSSFENKTTEKTNVNDIQLYLNDINIPNNAIVDKITLDLYTDTREPVIVSTAYQTNANLAKQNDNINGVFDIKTYNIYTKYNLNYLYNKLRYYQEKDNEEQIEYYKMLIDKNLRENSNISIDFSKENPLILQDSYWNEVSFEKTESLLSSDVKNVYLILEGYNYSNEVDIEAQLVHYDGIETPQNISIQSGYFYKKIPINYNAKYDISSLSIRFKFNNIECIKLYDVKTQIQFTSPQNINNIPTISNSIKINDLNKYSLTICENLDGDKIKNGFNLILSFSDIQNYIKIYSAVVNIIYHEKAFANIIETTSDFNVVNASNAQDLIINGAIFDEKVSDMRQDAYTMKKPNGEYDAGFEMNHKIYQAFTAEENNITSIELKLNGRTGAPDNYLKIAILDNYDNLPNNILKEVIIDISQYSMLNNEAYKFNICVNDLIVGDTYWFSIEPLNKDKQGSRRFLYNNYQIGNYKLLSELNGDIINQHASLYFRLYSKANIYPFNQLPFSFEPKRDIYTKDVNLITEIQVLDGEIENLTESLFDTYYDYPNDNSS